jgi:hypothetical protein
VACSWIYVARKALAQQQEYKQQQRFGQQVCVGCDCFGMPGGNTQLVLLVPLWWCWYRTHCCPVGSDALVVTVTGAMHSGDCFWLEQCVRFLPAVS